MIGTEILIGISTASLVLSICSLVVAVGFWAKLKGVENTKYRLVYPETPMADFQKASPAHGIRQPKKGETPDSLLRDQLGFTEDDFDDLEL